jgi:diguanylate cyclase (GGDEF)-like protein
VAARAGCAEHDARGMCLLMRRLESGSNAPMSSERQGISLDQMMAKANDNVCADSSLAEAILDSLTANVALVDSTGVIKTANAAWRRFANDNRCIGRGHYIGANYLAICEDAVRRDGDPTAAAALTGIRAVLRHEQDSYTLEYPCHSPSEKRWFRLRATRLLLEGLTACVVAHENITTEKLAEEALRDAERQLRESLERERSLARTDELTGLVNRRHFLELAEHECAVARRYGLPLAVVLFDLDGFKKLNDSLGHLAGDEILKDVARRAGEQVRSADILARYGGEEFVVLVPESTAQSAAVIAERIRKGIAGSAIHTTAGFAAVTMSAGVGEMQSGSDTLEDLIRRADRALYDAKRAGRNRTVVHPCRGSDAQPPGPTSQTSGVTAVR